MHKTENSRRNVIYVIAFVDLSLPPATKLGQGYVFTGVCDSVNRGCLPQYMLGYHTPSGSRPPGADPPKSRHPTGSRHPPKNFFCNFFFCFFGLFFFCISFAFFLLFLHFFPFFFPFLSKFLINYFIICSPLRQCMLGDTGNKRAVRILLKCILVFGLILEQE